VTSRRRLDRRQLAVAVAAAGVATAVLHAAARLPPEDPFRGTLLLLPAVVAALELIGRAHGAPLRRREGALAGGLLGCLTILALGRHSLGLNGAAGPLYAGFLLLLAWRLGRLLPALRRRLGHRLPARPPAVFFGLPLLVYLALLPWANHQRPPDGDEPYYLLLTHSLAYDLDVDLANNYAAGDWRAFLQRPLAPQPGDPVGDEGQVYSRHNLLLPLFLAPFYRLAGLAGALVTMCAFAAFLAWMVLRLAYRYAPQARPGGALLAWALCAFAPPLLFYSHQIWIEVPAAVLLAVALDRLQGLRRDASAGAAFALAVPLVLLPLLKLRLALPALGVLVLTLMARRRPALIAGGVTAAAVTALLAVNQLRYDNPLKMHSWRELGLFNQPPMAFLLGGLGMFYDAAFGLFASAPIWLLLVPALWVAVRRRRPLLRDLALVSLPYLALLAPRLEWYGGWSPPFRYPLVFLPLLALVAAPLLARRGAALRLLLAVLVPATLLLGLLLVTVPGWTYNLADGGTHLLDAAGARLGADVGRFFPSMVRPRLASWLWPLASLLLIPAALCRRLLPLPAAARAQAGVVALLLGLGLLPWAAVAVPSRTIEMEDGFVSKRGGTLHPPPWTTERPRYRGGWSVVAGSRVSAPVVGRGPVRLRLALRYVEEDPAQPFTLAIAAGAVPIRAWPAAGRGWQVLDLGPVDWPPNAPLVLRGPPAVAGRRNPNSVIVDYVDLRWD